MKKEYDVVFAFPNHFNREKGKNPYFIPFIEACKKHNLKYIVFEDTDLKGTFNFSPRDNDNIPFEFIGLMKMIYRKVLKLGFIIDFYDDDYRREEYISKKISKFFFKNFRFKVSVNIAGNNATFFKLIDNSAKVYEYQHGIISNTRGSKELENVIMLVYGNGFQQVVLENKEFYAEKNVISVGYYKKIDALVDINKSFNKTILFSLQITNDRIKNKDLYEKYKKVVNNLFLVNQRYLKENNYKIIFKHHPRFPKQEIDFFHKDLDSSIFSVDKNSLTEELCEKYTLHITFDSTTTFELALKGIPTIFIDHSDYKHRYNEIDAIYNKQYDYPLKDFFVHEYTDLEVILRKIENANNYSRYSKEVYKWGKFYFSEFNEDIFLSFLRKN